MKAVLDLPDLGHSFSQLVLGRVVIIDNVEKWRHNPLLFRNDVDIFPRARLVKAPMDLFACLGDSLSFADFDCPGIG